MRATITLQIADRPLGPRETVSTEFSDTALELIRQATQSRVEKFFLDAAMPAMVVSSTIVRNRDRSAPSAPASWSALPPGTTVEVNGVRYTKLALSIEYSISNVGAMAVRHTDGVVLHWSRFWEGVRSDP